MYYVANNIHSIKAHSVRTGDIVFTLDTNDCYIANKNKEYVKVQYSKQDNNQVRPTNCKNCGAPLTSYKCEYCDTKY